MIARDFAVEVCDLLDVDRLGPERFQALIDRIAERDAVLAGPKPESELDPGGVDEGARAYRSELPTLTEVQDSDNPWVRGGHEAHIIRGED